MVINDVTGKYRSFVEIPRPFLGQLAFHMLRDLWKLVISCHPPGWWQVALDLRLRHTWNTSGNLQNQAFYRKCWQNRFSLKIQKQKNPTTLYRSSLSPPDSRFKCFFHLHAWPLWLRRPRSSGSVLHSFSGIEWHVSPTLNRLPRLGFHELFRGHTTCTFPPSKKMWCIFWEFAPGENGKKHNKRDVQ